MTFATGYVDTLQVQLYLLAAAGLGVCFAILTRLRDTVPKGTYDEGENFTVFASLVLGVVGGTILAFLVPASDVAGLGTLTKPVLALVGGFSSGLVFRVLTRVADAIEGIFAPAPEDQAAAAIEKTALAVRDANTSSAQEALRISALPQEEQAAELLKMAQRLTDE